MMSPDLLSSEVTLDVEISSNRNEAVPVSSANAVLLTGATGFLGSFLLQQLLSETDAEIYCLTRANDISEGKRKICDSQLSYGLQTSGLSHRIIAVIGDLGSRRLGIPADDYHHLANHIDIVYHCAARLNFLSSYPVLKAGNVDGTREIIRFAAHEKIKSLHYISSTAIFESPLYAGKTVCEADREITTVNMAMGYSQSKWVAEQIVLLAGRRGLPVNIYRIPFIAGHSRTGVGNTNDFVCRMTKGCIQAGCVPDLNFILDLAPVDYISRALHYLSNHKRYFNNVYHLNNPSPLRWEILCRRIKNHGYPLELIPYEKWQHRICNMDKESRLENAIYPLLPFVLRKWHKEQLTLLELYQQHHKPYIDCRMTIESLGDGGITCPAADSNLIDTYLSYWRQIGFLD